MAVDHNTRVMRKAINDLKSKVGDRRKDNKEILNILEDLIELYPSMRFCQLLSALDLDRDRFNEEPADTLVTIKEKLTELSNN